MVKWLILFLVLIVTSLDIGKGSEIGLAPPTNYRVGPENTEVLFMWDAHPLEVDGYIVYFRRQNLETCQILGVVDSNTLHYELRGLSKGTTYEFQVVAFIGEYLSRASDTVVFTP